jgi:hypothetical protein
VNGVGLDGGGLGMRFPARAKDSSFRHSVQTGSEALPVSYSMDTGGSFSEDKLVAGVN